MESLSTGSFACEPFVAGRGCWLYGDSGQRYFDGTSGSGAVSLGHNHPAVLARVSAQLDLLVHTGCKLNSDVREELIEKLADLAPWPDCAVLPTVIGTEAVEAALKIARSFTGRRHVLMFRHAFHGKSSGALAVTWREELKSFSSLNRDEVLEGTFPLPEELQSDSAIESRLDEFRRLMKTAVANDCEPAAVIVEPIQVTEGVLLAGRTFLEGVIQIAHQYGVLVVFDEIYTGFGRAGSMFYCQQLDTMPDLLLVGKSLGNGWPISAVCGPSAVINSLPHGVQTSTFTGHPVCCAAASRVVDLVSELRTWEIAERRGSSLLTFLGSLAEQHSWMTPPRGAGLLLAFDCIDDAGTWQPAVARKFLQFAQQHGVLLFGGGFAGATVKLVPPITMDDRAVSFLEDRLAAAAENVTNEVVKYAVS